MPGSDPSVELDPGVYDELRAAAEREDLPVGDLLDDVVREFLDLRASIEAYHGSGATARPGELADEGTPPPPIAALLGIRPVEVGEGRAVMELRAGERHANPMGTLHGGVLGDLADLAMGATYASTLGPDESFTAVEFKINFLEPVWTGEIRATAELVRRGRTLGLVECDVVNGDGDLVARASSTCLALRGESAEGR